MPNILLTGGTGFIGSHIACDLLEKGFNVIIIDSLINSKKESLNRIKAIVGQYGVNYEENIRFFKGDLRDTLLLNDVFSKIKIDAVIHLAGLKAVEESVFNPLKYWEINLLSTINLLQIMEKFECNTIIFSSSASIYNICDNALLTEDSFIKSSNPYGSTKIAIEQILNEIFLSKKDVWRVANLRYFNPIGAHNSGLLGEDISGKPTNIFPQIINVALKKLDYLRIFGNNWDTNDGTCVRDYIHIMDLSEGHIRTLDYLLNSHSQIINMNIGTGLGTSVLELVKIFEESTNIKITYLFDNRRAGDKAFSVADNSYIKKVLSWSPQKDLKTMCQDGWKWYSNNLNEN